MCVISFFKNFFNRFLGLFFVIVLLSIGFTGIFQRVLGIPAEIRLFLGQAKYFNLGVPVSAIANVNDPKVIQINGLDARQVSLDLAQPVQIAPQKTGSTSLTLKLFGQLPIKELNVRVLPPLHVIPGGQSIGVQVNSAGLLVIGYHDIATTNDLPSSPAESAGLDIGDYLTKIYNQPINSIDQLTNAVRQAGERHQKVHLQFIRDGEEKNMDIMPTYDLQEKRYSLGLYIRDSAAGVGTLTFYDPQNQVYGALGHRISDVDTGKPIILSKGRIFASGVTSIQKGEVGEPGQKRAIFLQEDKVLGNINKNTPFGIFGNISALPPGDSQWNRPLPVALPEQVHEGPAQILTVVDGQKVESFSISIEHVVTQKAPATKGMVIKVTDPKLIEKTGGIVQGMSGSPIIQDGRIIGAVTHVFVNEPRAGYGTFLEWMLQDAGLIQSSREKVSSYNRTIDNNEFKAARAYAAPAALR